MTVFTHVLFLFCKIEEEKGDDSFDMHISVSDPEKVGEYTLIPLPCSPGISWNNEMCILNRKDKRNPADISAARKGDSQLDSGI